jgi:hypothetical protein
MLFASSVTTAPATATAQRLTAEGTGTSEDCLRQYWECSFNTDRPVNQPDCFEQFMVCLQAQIG